MSTLLIVRHGQASFGAADYDQLSELGAQQSLRLGEYLAEQGRKINTVYCGPAKRHRQTLQALASAVDLSLPEARFDDGLAEFPAFKLVAMHSKDDELSSFKRVIDSWMRGELDCGELESAETFCRRVHESVASICRESAPDETTLVITSGGPTMAVAKLALALSPTKAAQLLWAIANSSVSEFRYRNEELSLQGFNCIAHLGRHEITYR